MKNGIFLAAGAYVIWGFFPIYFKLIHEVPAVQIVSHRIIWSFILLSCLVLIRKEWARLRTSISSPKYLLIFLVSSLLLAANWLVYVYGVNAGFIVETSLGYFISPLASILLGVVILRERMRSLQWIAVALSSAGVLYLTFHYGRLPWIAILIALSFSFYGLAKKTAPLGSFYGLTLETGMLFIPCLVYLIFVESTGSGSFGHTGLLSTVLLMLTGPVTAAPLPLFGAAAKKIDLSMLGFLQYIAPTLQFLIGVGIYKEAFTLNTLIGFLFIWAALVILWLEGYSERRRLQLITKV